MPEIKNTFLRGRMNQDLDERLISNGEYRDAYNVQVASTESSNAGTVQNVAGNRYANCTLDPNDVCIPGQFTTTYGIGGTCVGIKENEETNKLYLFIKGTSVDAIIEYDSVEYKSVPVIVDAEKSILKFSDSKITSIIILDDFLAWTDNINEPRIIDISNTSIFKNGSLDGNGKAQYTNTTRIEQADGVKDNIIESDITLIRKKPHNAPKFILASSTTNTTPTLATVASSGTTFDIGGVSQLLSERIERKHEEKFVRFAYRWKFKNGQYSIISPFSEPLFFPNSNVAAGTWDLKEGHNDQMVNNITNALLVNMECGDGRNNTDKVNNIEFLEVLYKESNNNNIYIYKTLTTSQAIEAYTNGKYTSASGKSRNLSAVKGSKKAPIPEEEVYRTYDNVPQKAKALDIVGNRLVFGNYTDGLDLEGYEPQIDTRVVRREYVEDEPTRNYWDGGSTLQVSGFVGVTADTVKDTATIKSGRKYQIGIVFEDEYGRQSPIVTNDSGIVDLDFDTSYDSQKGNGFGRKLRVYQKGLPPGVQQEWANGTTNYWKLNFINLPKSIDDFTVKILGGGSNVLQTPTTHYTYDTSTGIVTFTSGNTPAAGRKVIFNLNVVKRFKYFVKQSAKDYYNFAVDQVNQNSEDSDTVWLVVPSTEINKVQENDNIILKKQINTINPINYGDDEDNYKFKVLDKQKAPPAGMVGTGNYSDSFFIKVKSTTFNADGSIKTGDVINDNIGRGQGTGGINKEITKNDVSWNTFNFGKYQDSANYLKTGLFLGAVSRQDGGNLHQIHRYYFFCGGIYEIIEEQTAQQSTTFDETQNNNNICGNNDADGWALSTSGPDLSGITHIDITGTVENVYYKYDSNGFPTNFYVCYSGASILDSGSNAIIPFSSPAVFETIPDEDDALEIYYETSQSFHIDDYGESINNVTDIETDRYIDLDWHNAFVMGSGVESNRIQDDFNDHSLETGIRASVESSVEYSNRTNKTSLIYSGIFNAQSGINKLNVFNTGLKITKELNPEYGSIQKLHTRDTDLIALCEDKILNILANKDALFNADGNVNLTATENVLGQAVAYAGEYGISKNPESFASHGFRAYFTDKARGVVLRLSKDGLTVISSKGMTAYFRENMLNESGTMIGFYDVYTNQYILSMPITGSSISFKEETDGWTSRLSILPDSGISVNGKFYTCKSGELYLQHAPNTLRNNFYGSQYNSGIKLIVNSEPSIIKSFKTIGYEGTDGWLSKLNGTDVIVTDQQKGEVLSFTEKEGKFYSHISGVEEELDTLIGDDLDSRLKDFSIQGLGNITSHSGVPVTTTTTTTSTTTTTTTSTTTSTTTLSCGLTLAVSSYNTGNSTTTLTGTFSGSSYTNSDSIALTVSNGTISPTSTTKSALAAGLTVTLSQAVDITAKMTSGACYGTEVTIAGPQDGSVIISAVDTAFLLDIVTLTANTTGTVSSYQWYKSTSTGFTPGASNIISGAVYSTLETTESSADTIYYKVKLNGNTDSPEHDIVWSARSSFSAKYVESNTALQTACDSSTTRTIYADTGTFNTATQFFSNSLGDTDNFVAGTYSNSTDGSDNHYRYIDSNGIPGTAIACSTTGSALQAVTAYPCQDSSNIKNFNITKGTDVEDLVSGKVITFSATQGGHTHWVVDNANYTGGVYNYTPTLANVYNANTCITNDAPTLSLTGGVDTFTNDTITLTATPSHSSQGGTYSYQFQRSTDNNTFSSLGSAISGTSAAQDKETTEASVDTIYYRCVLNGSITSNVVTTNITGRPEYELKRENGSDIATDAAACAATNDVTLYGDQITSLANTVKFYTSAAGATATITQGTYSDGTYYAFVDANRNVIEKTVGSVTSRWHLHSNCGAQASMVITGATTANTNATAVLTSDASNYTPTSYTWTRTPPGGSAADVQTGSSNQYGASESSAGAYTYGVTAVGTDGNTGATISKTDTHTVTFSQLTQTMTVQLCPAGVTRNVTISNAGGYTNGQVIKLAAASPVAAGSYTITNASYSGSVDATTTVTDLQPASTCCNSIGCSATISMTVGGSASTAGAIELGQTVVLTGSASGYTAASYKWYESTDNGSTYGNIVGTSSTYTPDNTQAGTIVYKCTVVGSQSEEESTTKSISWYAATASTRYYNLQGYQTNCNDDDVVTTGAYESVNALSTGTVVDLANGTTCYKIASIGSGNASTPLITNIYADCTACQNALADTSACTATFNTSGYSASGGNFTLTGFFGSSYSNSDDFNLTVDSGTVSPSTATVSTLANGVTVTASPGVNLTLTSRIGANCVGTTHSVTVPLSSCNAVTLYATSGDPSSDSGAAAALCGSGRTGTVYLNTTSLATASQVYVGEGCTTLASGPWYLSADASNYYVWTGYVLQGPYQINCP